MEVDIEKVLDQLQIDKMSFPGGWNKDRWAVTQTGNQKEFYAEHENGVMLWYTPPTRMSDEYTVKAGTSTRFGGSTTLSREPNEAAAEATIQRAMALFPQDPEAREMKYEL